MTLRARLLTVTVAMVAVVVLALVALNLNSLVAAWIDFSSDRAEIAGREVQSFVVRRLVERTAAADRPTKIGDIKKLWMQTVASDGDVASLVEQTMAQSRSIVEIEVAGEDGRILASSNPTRRGTAIITRADLRSLGDENPVARIRAIMDSGADYQTMVTLGIPGQVKPVFTIQVLSSLILLRAAVLPDIRNLALISTLALAAAITLAWWAAATALKPLVRVSHLIDTIYMDKESAAREAAKVYAAEGAGAIGGDGSQTRHEHGWGSASGARELAVIESKLSLLGERYRNVQDDATRLRSNLDHVLERLDGETRKQFENEILLSRRLAAINSLTGRVAHEIKNPLNSIVLRLDMLKARLSEEVPDAEPELVILSQEVIRLDRVVRTFLDFNRPVEVNIADLNVVALVTELVDFLAPEAARKGIELQFIHKADLLMIRADDDLLRQALTNIAINGIEAMEGGRGRLRIEVGQEEGLSVIRVSDTGPGISRENREKIFQLYFTTKRTGTGIGLAMTFRAIQLQAGTIDWVSEPGQGTTFRIVLPLAASLPVMEARV
jgi:signal transduction histidine kinase